MSQGFSKATKAMCKAGLTRESMRMRQLKRENAWMRQWVVKLMSLVEMNGPAADVYCEIRAKLPDLFKAKRRGRK